MSAPELHPFLPLELPSQTFAKWRAAARIGLNRGVAPERFNPAVPELSPGDPASAISSPKVPAHFLTMARSLSLHKDETKWGLLYHLLWRLNHGEAGLLFREDEPQVIKARFMEKAVIRDIHKMRVFLRFQPKKGLLFAWYEPTHHITEAIAPYFAERLANYGWVIHTPSLSVRWNLKELEFSPGLPHAPRFLVDESEDTWSRYQEAQAGSAKVLVMPKKRLQKNPLKVSPETTNKKPAKPAHNAEPPDTLSLSGLKTSARACLVCPFARQSTQTVFGEGPGHAEIMVVGEQPGDQEDRQGHPFVGPAGALFDALLQELGMDRRQVYVTNAVKHFKFEERGKLRLHVKPNASEIHACRPWLEREIALIRPKVILALGATAASSLCQRAVRIGAERGRWLNDSVGASRILVSWHPSAILRSVDDESRRQKRAQLKADLAKVRDLLGRHGASSPSRLSP